MPKNVKEGPSGFFNIQFLAKHQKIEGKTFGDIEFLKNLSAEQKLKMGTL